MADYSLKCSIRPAKTDELPFLLNSFQGGMKRLRLTESADRRLLAAQSREWMANAFSHPSCSAMVAELDEAQGVLAGWSLTTQDTLLFAYTKTSYRRSNVCRALLREAFGEKVYPKAFAFHTGAFGVHLRKQGCLYAPLASMLVGGPSDIARNLLEM